jgi:glycosyltransferase involved in cell wall biosynthesis
MKILIFNWRDPKHPWAGGAEVFLYQVARYWIHWGHKVTWLCSRHANQPQYDKIDGIEIVRKGGIYSVYPATAAMYVIKMRQQFDILFDSVNGIPFFTPLFSRKHKVALIHHIHKEVFFRELPRHLAHLGNFIEHVGMPLVYHHTPFIAVSDSTRQAMIKMGIPGHLITVIHNGVESERFRPGVKSSSLRILFLGRLRRYKSVDVIIRAMPIILQQIPEIHLDIVGSGPMAKELQSLVEKLGMSDRIHFHGFVSEMDKLEFLRQAHIAIQPSMKEGWGLTVLEANACGTPVIAANVPGLIDSVIDGETGILVPHGDPAMLAHEVVALLTDVKRYQRISQAAVEWARRFNWKQSARSCLELFTQLVQDTTPIYTSRR